MPSQSARKQKAYTFNLQDLEISTTFKLIFKNSKYYLNISQLLNLHIFQISCRSYVQERLKEVYRIRLFICKTQTVLTLHKWVIGYAQLLYKCAARTTQYNHLLLHLAEKCCVSERPLCCVLALQRGLFPSSSAFLMLHHKHLRVRIYNTDAFLWMPLSCFRICPTITFCSGEVLRRLGNWR